MAKALDPSSKILSALDRDTVSLSRKLDLELFKNFTYVEGADEIDTIDYVFEVRKRTPAQHEMLLVQLWRNCLNSVL